ncbi:acylphosphatase [Candidatus Bathyarchaeota archaeon]|nr:acylphosphatase [Candidatus Bathyarchaeota archaeon]MBL7080037.1 acylphosphatase [Candidatus Bathyarchaeota archaeon]
MRAHIYVSGRVQGVYYRKNARRSALSSGLVGWVRNLPDRRVEAVAEGERGRVEEFLRWCREGPSMAIVRDLEVRWEAATGEFETFRIVY